MDGVTQQNAALVEQAASAAKSLQDQAAEVANVVSIFKLDVTQQMQARHAPEHTAAAAPAAARAEVKKLPARPAQRKPAAVAHADAPRKLAAVASGNTGNDDWEEF